MQLLVSVQTEQLPMQLMQAPEVEFKKVPDGHTQSPTSGPTQVMFKVAQNVLQT